MAARRPYGPEDALTSLETALQPVRHPGLFELSWNWRWELGLLGSLVSAAGLIAGAIGPLGLAVAAGAGLTAGAAALLCLPSARHWAAARLWCLITPHRIRAGCVNAWVQTRNGKLPFVTAVRPTEYGEEVRVWLRAGLTAGDLHAARDVLAVACWATEVRVIPDDRRAHLVILQVIRKRPAERRQAGPGTWPPPRQATGDGPGETAERDTRGWPSDIPLAS
jgi:hypothetical protein